MEPNTYSQIEQGKYFFKVGKFQKAEDILRPIIETTPHFADVFNVLGLVAHADGRYSEAEELFQRALQINPQYTEAMLNLSIVYNDLGEHAKAKSLVAASRRDAKKSSSVMDPFIRSKLANKHAEVAEWYRGIGAFKQAAVEYQKALDLEKGYADLRTKRAMCLRELKDYATAIKELKTALKLRPRYVEAYVQMGLTYVAMGKLTQGKKIWAEALKKFPKDASLKMYQRFSEGCDS